jgi:hypothetical protein
LGSGPTAFGALRDRYPAAPPRAVEVFAVILTIPCWDPAFEGLRLIEAIALPFSPAAAPHAGPEGTCGSGFFVVEIGRSARLFGGDAPQAHTFIGEENGRSSQQKLAELQDRIQAPTLEKQNATTQQANGCEEDVVIPCQRRLKAAHEIEKCPAHREHNAHDAGPIEAGINHGVSPVGGSAFEALLIVPL